LKIKAPAVGIFQPDDKSQTSLSAEKENLIVLLFPIRSLALLTVFLFPKIKHPFPERKPYNHMYVVSYERCP
jgi:hypothetical protein